MIHGNPLFILLLCLAVLEKLLQVTEPRVQAPLSIKEWDLRSLDYGKVGLQLAAGSPFLEIKVPIVSHWLGALASRCDLGGSWDGNWVGEQEHNQSNPVVLFARYSTTLLSWWDWRRRRKQSRRNKGSEYQMLW